MNPTPPPVSGRSRELFLGLWIVIVLAYGIWRLPGPDSWQRDPQTVVAVEIGRELEPMIVEASVTQRKPHSFTLTLRLRDEYRETIPTSGREFQIGYQFRKGTSVLSRGFAPVHLLPDATIDVVIPNRDNAFPDHIGLSLVP